MSEHDLTREGYELWHGEDPFEDYIGPLYYKQENGQCRCAFVISDHHVNSQGGLNGGMLMAFGDYALFLIARSHLSTGKAVTLTFDAQFTAVAKKGELVECTGEVVHETGGLLFMRGMVFSGDTLLLNFTATLKKLRPAS